MNKKILCIGNVAYDITFPMRKYPEENTKNRINKKIECGGGPASNAAYLLGKWNQDVYFAGIVGNDIYGNKIKDEFKTQKVNIDYMETSNKIDTTLSIVVVGQDKDSRTTFANRNPKLKMEAKMLDIKPDVILIDGQEFELSMNMIKENKEAISIIDAGRNTPEVIELCKNVNYIACSKKFAESVTNIKIDFKNTDTFTQVFEKLMELFPNKKYVITLEEKGSIFLDDDDYIKYMPTYRMNVKDTTGAGDIFHGAFTYGIANGYSLENSVKLGNIAGALSTTKIGSRNSVPTLKQVMEYYEK
ncbi:MAG: carbohydrate kinase family protein [Bacilli bacterium]|nr:carbohydrate kinase family protein [Bacilli bacterium]